MTKQELIAAIEKADKEYWSGNAVIADTEYDKLVEQLRSIDPAHPLIVRINAPIVSGAKVLHARPMLSLNKVYTNEDLFAWVRKQSRDSDEVFLIQPKYDGISAKLDGGVMATRGDGNVGENITSKLPIVDIETNLTDFNPSKDYLLGELVIKNSDFTGRYSTVRTSGGTPFKNSRNAVAGIVGIDDVSFYEKQGARLTLVDYEKISWRITSAEFEKKWSGVYNELITLDYPMDGIVIKLADTVYADSLGYTGHHPKSQIALKFVNQSKWTVLDGVEFSMGKEQLSVVGLVKPIELGGVTISRVKLPVTAPAKGGVHLMDGSLQIGDEVLIERAGDVIPYLSASKEGTTRKRVVFDVCPFCGAPLNISETRVVCTNSDCFEPMLNRLYFSVSTLGMFGIGKSLVRTIMEETGVRTLGDFMELRKERLFGLPDFGVVRAENIILEIEKAKKAEAYLVLTALNVPSLGHKASKELLKRYTVDEVVNHLTYDGLLKIDGFGPVMTKEIVDGISANREYIKNTLSHFDMQATVAEEGSSKGTICFTGKSTYKRSDMEARATEKGYTPVDSVSSSLTILVTADPASKSSKITKALKLGVKIISEDEFWKL